MPWQPPVHRPFGWQDKRGRDRDYAVHRDRASVALITSSAWRRARQVFLTTNPLCVDCGRAATVVDHRAPHRGDPVVFWDRSGWQPMCASCHGRKTASCDGGFGRRRRIERAAPEGGWGVT